MVPLNGISPFYSERILGSFVDIMLNPVMTEPIQYLLLPYLTNWENLPFVALVKCCQEKVQTIDSTSSCFLLYTLLKLTEGHVSKLDRELITPYLEVVAQLTSCIWRLPRKSLHNGLSFSHHDEDQEDETMNEDDSDDEEMDTDGISPSDPCALTALERETLREIVVMLNENALTECIMSLVNVDSLTFLNSLCQICHVLMVYNRSAIYEYRLVYLLCAKTKFIRTLWHTITMQPHGHKFTSPLNLISKGILVRKYNPIFFVLGG